MTTENETWAPVLTGSEGPLYRAIADAIARDVDAGRLAPGARLPPQRTLAKALGVDFTTIGRAYAEARSRGLVEGRVGQGTYVLAPRRTVGAPAAASAVDLSMNLPPRFDDPALVERMWREVAELGVSGLDILLRYDEAGGALADREAGAKWLSARLPGLAPGRLIVCPGVHGALLAAVGALAGPGEAICGEALTYPGLRAITAQLGVRLIGLAIDGEGVLPDAFEDACRREAPKAFCCTPTLHSPTTATMSLARREAITQIARRHGVPIIEDDAYGMLAQDAPRPLASLAPELTLYITGLAKCVSPALRIAYLAAPDARLGSRVKAAVRATAVMASPLTAAIATRWIQSGTAGAVAGAIRAESQARQSLAARILPAEAVKAHPDGFHLWLTLPERWTRGAFAGELRFCGVGVVASDAFSSLPSAPEAVRIGLGGPIGRPEVERALILIAERLEDAPAASSAVV